MVMKIYRKAIVIYGGFLLTGITIGAVVFNTSLKNSSAGILLFFAPVFVFSWLARRELKCPHCGKHATQLPNLFHTPWVGSKCRSCGKDY